MTVLGDTVHHFHEIDADAVSLISAEIAAVLRRVDDRKLLELQHNATAGLLAALNDATPPAQHWPVLAAALQSVVDGGMATRGLILIRQRSSGKYSVKVSTNSGIVSGEFDGSHDEVMRTITRTDHGELDLARLRRRAPGHPLLLGAESKAWVATYSSVDTNESPLLMAVLFLQDRTVYSEPFGERQLDHIFEHIASAAFAFTRVVLMVTDFAAVSRTHSQLIVSETHDIAQQLTNIKHAAERLLITSPASVELGRIVESADDLLVRVDNMIYQNWFVPSHVTSDEASEHRDEPQAINIVDLVQGVVDTVRSRHPRSVFTFSTPDLGRPRTECLVFGRHRWLSVALRNVLDNAYKFGRAAPVEVEVRDTVSSESGGEAFLVTVQDHGIGIPKDQFKAIFRPGHRNPYSRKLFVGGSQIALSVTRDIINEHGGEIWVESQLKKGTSVYIKLPRYLRGA